MKKTLSLLIVCIFISSGIGVAAAHGQSTLSPHSASPLDDDVPVWNVGDAWTYTIHNITVNYTQGAQGIFIDGNIDDFSWTVSDTTGDYYTVAVTGKVNATYDFSLASQSSTIRFVGSFKPTLTRLKGTMQFTKSDLQIHSLSFQLLGLTMTKINSLPFALPFPFRLVSEGSLSVDFPLFDFPLYGLKFWDLPDFTLTMSSTFAGIFGLIQLPFTVTVHHSWVPLSFWAFDKQDVTVEAGTYSAYRITSIVWDYFVYYYAPDVGNLIKIDASLPNGGAHAELKSTNYP